MEDLKKVRRFFVYGSLMEGFSNYDGNFDNFICYRAKGKYHGLLYHLVNQNYPALIEGDAVVYGEIIELADFHNMVVKMDEYEGYFGKDHPENLYHRKIVVVDNLDEGKKEEVYIYYYAKNDINSSDKPAVHIQDGDWRNYMKKEKAVK